MFAKVPDFNNPIEALYICHENILKRMDTMETLARTLLDKGPEAFPAQVEIWREVFSFIRHSIANHTRDEEEGLFPALAAHNALPIDQMQTDHNQAEVTEKWLMELFEEMAGSDVLPDKDRLKSFAGCAVDLAGFYRNHIAVENETIFPAAERELTEEEKLELGRLMRHHRNITVTLPPGI
jgi:regulator of cell morphogenesis and NO signaling